MAHTDFLNALRDLMGDTSVTASTETIDSVSFDVEFQTWTTSQTISSSTNLGSGTADTKNVLVRYDGDLTINSSQVLSTSVRKRGLFIYVKGNLIINGTMTMTARGAIATGQNCNLITIGATTYSIAAAGTTPSHNDTWGGTDSYNGTGFTGPAGANGAPGGGGGGSAHHYGHSGRGGIATSYSGGAGGGGATRGGTAGDGNDAGGAGGNAVNDAFAQPGSGGAGNNGGSGISGGSAGSNGTGGLIVIFCDGNVTVNSGGIISSNGANGGYVSGDYTSAGGGSGGGGINIFHAGTYTNSGTVQALGGEGGPGGAQTVNPGGPGGVGSIQTIQYTNSTAFTKDLSDSFTASDSFGRMSEWLRTLTDTFTFSEAFASLKYRIWQLVLSDSVVVSDSLKRFWKSTRAILTSWVKQDATTSSWKKENKANKTWSKGSIHSASWSKKDKTSKTWTKDNPI